MFRIWTIGFGHTLYTDEMGFIDLIVVCQLAPLNPFEYIIYES